MWTSTGNKPAESGKSVKLLSWGWRQGGWEEGPINGDQWWWVRAKVTTKNDQARCGIPEDRKASAPREPSWAGDQRCILWSAHDMQAFNTYFVNYGTEKCRYVDLRHQLHCLNYELGFQVQGWLSGKWMKLLTH